MRSGHGQRLAPDRGSGPGKAPPAPADAAREIRQREPYGFGRNRARFRHALKRLYNRHALLRPLFVAAHAPVVFACVALRRLRGAPTIERGMSHRVNMLDWLGGYPFEAARPEAVFRRRRNGGFVLAELATRGARQGGNEFVFRRPG